MGSWNSLRDAGKLDFPNGINRLSHNQVFIPRLGKNINMHQNYHDCDYDDFDNIAL